MKTGMSLQDMAVEIDRQSKVKRDFISPTKELSCEIGGADEVGMNVGSYGFFTMTPTAHTQVATRLEIPKAYYDKMLGGNKELLRENVNAWLAHDNEKRMVRTLDSNMRAFLSHRYRPLDYLDLAKAALPVIQQMGCRIESCALTETRMYIKAVTDRLTADVAVGDTVQAGIVISTSEVGMGSVRIEPLAFQLRCLNGMIVNDLAMRKYHVGKGQDADMAAELFTNETQRADDRAFWMKVGDVIKGAFNEAVFKRTVNQMKMAKGQIIEAEVVPVTEVIRERYNLQEDEQAGILKHLIAGGDLSKYGLTNAITRAAQDVGSYDRATELERVGGLVLDMPTVQWEALAVAR